MKTKIKLWRLGRIMSPIENLSLSRREAYNCCIRSIYQAMDLCKTEGVSVRTNEDANALLLELLAEGYGRLSLGTKNSRCRYEWIKEQYFTCETARYLRVKNRLDQPKNLEVVRFSLMRKLLNLVNNPNCIDASRCQVDTYKEILCEDCSKTYSNLDRRDNIKQWACKPCLQRLEQYKREKEEKSFCTMCLQNRILSAYNLLCYDIYNTYQRKEKQEKYDKFLEIILVILAFKVENANKG